MIPLTNGAIEFSQLYSLHTSQVNEQCDAATVLKQALALAIVSQLIYCPRKSIGNPESLHVDAEVGALSEADGEDDSPVLGSNGAECDGKDVAPNDDILVGFNDSNTLGVLLGGNLYTCVGIDVEDEEGINVATFVETTVGFALENSVGTFVGADVTPHIL